MKACHLRASLVAALALFASRSSQAGAGPCTAVPAYEHGSIVGIACAEGAAPNVVLVSLDDGWAPRVLSGTAELPQAYESTFVALANERMGSERGWDDARRDRHFELFGISPSIGVVRRRLLDEKRHDCHARVDDTALRKLEWTLSPRETARAPARRAAVTALQAHLACEGLLPTHAHIGSFDALTVEALAVYQRLHMVPSPPVVDAATRDVLLTPSRELDFRSLLRALRERVVDATGLIEDGSALNAWEPVLGRLIDAAEYRYELRASAMEHGAPDLVSRATAAAATALGWVSAEAATAALAEPPPALVALPRPEMPAYYAAPLSLHVEIDRGAASDNSVEPRGRELPSRVTQRPTLTLFARTTAGDVALVRWPTTIGGWQRQRVGEGEEVLRYKPSPSGQFVWRELIAAPAWFPPSSSPERELVRPLWDGRWAANGRAVGPGYASAYGLIALLHHRAAWRDGVPLWVDVNVRTHGSGNYRSVLRGSSHGCHRLFNHLAIRLGSFLLAHHGVIRRGQSAEHYARAVSWRGHVYRLQAASRGYRFELYPPIDVHVVPDGPVPGPPPSARGRVSRSASERPTPAVHPGCA